MTNRERQALAALQAMDDGGQTFRVARRLEWPVPRTRDYMARLEALGFVRRDPHRSAINSVYWRVVDQ